MDQWEEVNVWSYIGLAFMVIVDIAMVCSLVFVFG